MQKAITGSLFLFIRQVGLNIINFFGNLILARILIPEDFGIYAVIQFMLAFLTLVGDGGFGAALIRKKEELKKEEIDAVFTYQQVIMAVITAVFILFTFLPFFELKNSASVWLFRVSALSYFMLSFRIIPVVMLEKEMLFGKIAFLEICETVAFQTTAVILAFMKVGVWAMVAGLIMKNLATVAVILKISDYKINYHWDFKHVKPLIFFGISFQGFHLVNMIKDSFVPVWIGTNLGMASVGYINWATTVANYPLLALNVISRLLFPFFSKIQDYKEKFIISLENLIRMNAFVIFGLSALIWALAEPITKILYTDKWMPAVGLFNFFIPINIFLAITYSLISAMNAKGKSNINFVFSIIWAVLLWIGAVLLVPKYGINGFAAANLIMNISGIFYFVYAKKIFGIRIFSLVFPALLAAAGTAVVIRIFEIKYRAESFGLLFILFIFGIIIYVSFAFLFSKGEYLRIIKMIFEKTVNMRNRWNDSGNRE